MLASHFRADTSNNSGLTLVRQDGTDYASCDGRFTMRTRFTGARARARCLPRCTHRTPRTHLCLSRARLPPPLHRCRTRTRCALHFTAPRYAVFARAHPRTHTAAHSLPTHLRHRTTARTPRFTAAQAVARPRVMKTSVRMRPSRKTSHSSTGFSGPPACLQISIARVSVFLYLAAARHSPPGGWRTAFHASPLHAFAAHYAWTSALPSTALRAVPNINIYRVATPHRLCRPLLLRLRR